MSETIYRAADQSVLFLWTWFGVRRRWLIAGSVVLAFADVVPDHSFVHMMAKAIAVIIGGMEWCAEATNPASVLNGMTLRFRQLWFVKAFLWIELLFFVADSVKALSGKSEDVLAAIASLGIALYFVIYQSLVPTGPRKKIKLPSMNLAPQVATA